MFDHEKNITNSIFSVFDHVVHPLPAAGPIVFGIISVIRADVTFVAGIHSPRGLTFFIWRIAIVNLELLTNFRRHLARQNILHKKIVDGVAGFFELTKRRKSTYL